VTTRTRSEQISAFYTANASRLREIVRRRAGVPAHVIDDACQTAWTTLLRRPDITLDDRGFSWLLVGAVHEAWRLASIARERPAGDFHGPAPHERTPTSRSAG